MQHVSGNETELCRRGKLLGTNQGKENTGNLKIKFDRKP